MGAYFTASQVDSAPRSGGQVTGEGKQWQWGRYKVDQRPMGTRAWARTGWRMLAISVERAENMVLWQVCFYRSVDRQFWNQLIYMPGLRGAKKKKKKSCSVWVMVAKVHGRNELHTGAGSVDADDWVGVRCRCCRHVYTDTCGSRNRYDTDMYDSASVDLFLDMPISQARDNDWLKGQWACFLHISQRQYLVSTRTASGLRWGKNEEI